MNPFVVASLAAAGLVAGWGQRAVIVRYTAPAGEPPRRECPACGHQLLPAWRPALPVTGRCPACHQRAGPSPLAAGIITAVLLGALAARVHPGLVLAAACWLALCAVPLAFVDAAVHRLPDPLTAAAYTGTAVLLVVAAAAGGHWPGMGRAALGGVALAGFYLLLVLISPAGMGMGDVKAAASTGTLLAWAGWRLLLVGGFAGFLLAAIYSIALLASGHATRKQHIPFGPFMLAGAFAAILAWQLPATCADPYVRDHAGQHPAYWPTRRPRKQERAPHPGKGEAFVCGGKPQVEGQRSGCWCYQCCWSGPAGWPCCCSTLTIVTAPPATVTVNTAAALITDAAVAPVMSAESPTSAAAGMRPATISVKKAMARPGTDQGEDVVASSATVTFRVPSSMPWICW